MFNAALSIKAIKQSIYQKGLLSQVWWNHLLEHYEVIFKNELYLQVLRGNNIKIYYVKKAKCVFK